MKSFLPNYIKTNYVLYRENKVFHALFLEFFLFRDFCESLHLYLFYARFKDGKIGKANFR